jgi:hypothetical protein
MPALGGILRAAAAAPGARGGHSVQTAKARHAMSDEGVQLFLQRPGEPVSQRYLLSDADIKRLCWGILADLDPEEAEHFGVVVIPTNNHAVRRPARVKLDGQVDQLLRALKPGPATNAALQSVTDITSKTIGSRMVTLINMGLVQRVDGGRGSGNRATYALTDDGLEQISTQKGAG